MPLSVTIRSTCGVDRLRRCALRCDSATSFEIRPWVSAYAGVPTACGGTQDSRSARFTRCRIDGVSSLNMPQTPVTVVAEVIAKAGKENEGRQLLLGLLEPTRKEEGCIQYDPHELADHPGHFVFYENWVSQAALDAHLK